MLILEVPYQEKDEAKRLGARWNPEIKKWYVERKEDYYKFAKWILPYGDIVVCDSLYIIEGKRKCFKCKSDTRVIAFAIESFACLDFLRYYKEGDEEYQQYMEYLSQAINSDEIQILGPIEPIPKPILEYIQDKYNYKMRYSKTTQESHYNNCCDNCDVLQGDFFLYEEVDSPFFIDSIEKVKALKIYKVMLKSDIIINCDSGFCEEDWMLKKYCDIIQLDIEC